MSFASIVVVVAQLALVSSGSSAADASARIVSSPPYVVGSPFEIELSLAESSAGAVFPKAPLDLGAFVIVAETTPDPARRRYAVIPALSGDLEFPALPVSRGTSSEAISSSPIPVRVESRMPPGPPRLVDGLELERPSRSSAWPTAILVVVSLVIVAILWRRRSARGEAPARGVGREPRALASLDALASRLDASDDAAATNALIEAAAIVRATIEARTGFPAPRRTTEETAAALLDASAMRSSGVTRLLVAADGAKYGGFRVAASEVRELVAVVRESLASAAASAGVAP